MATADCITRGREAFARLAWTDACVELETADRDQPLEPDDLQRLATALYLTGREDESAEVWARAHQAFLRLGHIDRAARCAFWLAAGLQEHRDHRARALAWVLRAQRMLDESQAQCVEHGYLQLSIAFDTLFKGDMAGAYAQFVDATTIGERFGDSDLIALGRHSLGRVLIRMGQLQEGVRLLDEAMVAVDAGEVSTIVMGDVYCSVIEGCLEIFDLRRAQEWTAALTRWCDSQPGLVPYSGQCLVRRAELLQLHGAWTDASAAAANACERLLQRGHPACGAAFYQSGELHRLRGELKDAEEAYRSASRYGRKPQPGLALLRLAQGQADAAATAIRLAIDETRSGPARSRLLAAYVEIMLTVGDVPAARAAADELAGLADDLNAAVLQAMAAEARGAVLLKDGDARAALNVLRQAWTIWQGTEAPYEAARVRVVIGLAYRALDDRDAAEMELDAARWIFADLGAGPDLARVEALARDVLPAAAVAHPLSTRELQVLRLVAAGKSNRAIAAELFISERTVERHVSNIFAKLNVSSRAAATAYAYEHQLV